MITIHDEQENKFTVQTVCSVIALIHAIEMSFLNTFLCHVGPSNTKTPGNNSGSFLLETFSLMCFAP